MSDTVKDVSNIDPYKKEGKQSIFSKFGNVFSNQHHNFIVRKSERLASALYVITGFMPPEEPLRSRLRVCALDLITRASNPMELSEGGAERFEYRCAEIATMLETARYGGLISDMNASLLGEEYAGLASFVKINAAKISERGHPLQKDTVSDSRSLMSPIRHASLIGHKKAKKDGSHEISGNVLKKRTDTILAIFDNKESISLKDAVSLIPDVSEKTIQRDLLSLVSDGVLVKTGSRRWTTYRKAPQA